MARGALLSASQLTTYDLVKGQLKASGLEDGPLVHTVASFTTSLSVATAIWYRTQRLEPTWLLGCLVPQ